MQHLAMVMDGNRRWAQEKKLEAVTLGHKKGVDAVRAAVRFCLKKNIPYLSLYTFSLENFKRSSIEKKYIFNLLAQVIKNDTLKLLEQGIRIRFIGDRDYFPKTTLAIIDEIEEKTKHLNKLNLNMLFCYGAQQEMICAAKRVAQKVKEGLLAVDEIDETALRREMWTSGIPDPDLIIRTGKLSRLSNFLLFQAAYSELVFPDCYWPEITEERLAECVETFYATQKNYGR